jgi:hypothetical protein
VPHIDPFGLACAKYAENRPRIASGARVAMRNNVGKFPASAPNGMPATAFRGLTIVCGLLTNVRLDGNSASTPQRQDESLDRVLPRGHVNASATQLLIR